MSSYDLGYPRSRGLGLIDDEDEDELWRRQQEIAALQPTASMRPSAPEPYSPPSRPKLGELMPQGDPEMDDRWRQAENTALDRSGLAGDDSYGFGEGLRDFAPMAIGGTLDLIFNKGRGLGALTAGGMDAVSRENTRRDLKKKAAGEYALDVRRQREAGGGRAIQAQQAALRGESLDLERSKLDLARQKLEGGAQDPESLARANYLESQAYKNWQGEPPKQESESEAGLRAAQTDLASSQAYKNWVGGGEKEDSPDLTYRKGRDALKDAEDAREAEELTLPIPGTKITNPEAFKRAMADKPTRRAIEKALTGYRGSQTALQNLEKLRSDEGVMVFDRDKAGEYDVQKRAALGGLGGLAELGTLQKSDIELLEPTIPNAGLGWEDASRLVGKDAKLDALKGARQGFRNMVDPRLAAWGIQYDYDFDPSKPGAPPPPPDQVTGPVATPRAAPPMGQRFDGRPDTSGDLSDLQNETLPPGGAPPFRAGSGRAQAAGAQPMPGGKVNEAPIANQLEDGSFDIEGEIYTADEVQRLRRKGLIR